MLQKINITYLLCHDSNVEGLDYNTGPFPSLVLLLTQPKTVGMNYEPTVVLMQQWPESIQQLWTLK